MLGQIVIENVSVMKFCTFTLFFLSFILHRFCMLYKTLPLLIIKLIY